jgi:hypothetical protein
MKAPALLRVKLTTDIACSNTMPCDAPGAQGFKEMLAPVRRKAARQASVKLAGEKERRCVSL